MWGGHEYTWLFSHATFANGGPPGGFTCRDPRRSGFFQQYKFYAAFETLGIPWELPGICWGLANLPCTDHVLKYVEWFVYVCVCLIDYHLLLSSTVITYHQISLTFINYI